MTKKELIEKPESMKPIPKNELIEKTEKMLSQNNLSISSKDLDRPWGAFWHISPESINNFLNLYFPDFNPEGLFISPKILLVEPEKRLSLQLHHKRSEKWHVIDGPVQVIAGDQDLTLNTGEDIILNSEKNHRLCGLENAGIVAEIWMHNNPSDPSTEEDIVRLEDDFHRN